MWVGPQHICFIFLFCDWTNSRQLLKIQCLWFVHDDWMWEKPCEAVGSNKDNVSCFHYVSRTILFIFCNTVIKFDCGKFSYLFKGFLKRKKSQGMINFLFSLAERNIFSFSFPVKVGLGNLYIIFIVIFFLLTAQCILKLS